MEKFIGNCYETLLFQLGLNTHTILIIIKDNEVCLLLALRLCVTNHNQYVLKPFKLLKAVKCNLPLSRCLE